MSSIKDKFLSAHRSQVKSSLMGRLSVFWSVVLFNALDYAALMHFWYSYHMAAVELFNTDLFHDLVADTVLCLLPLLSLVPSTMLFYASFALNIVKFWHVCHMAGRAVGIIVFNSLRISKDAHFRLYPFYITRLQVHVRSFMVAALRLGLIVLAAWYALVLERIRTAGGTGFEKKTAEEFELAALRRELEDPEEARSGGEARS